MIRGNVTENTAEYTRFRNLECLGRKQMRAKKGVSLTRSDTFDRQIGRRRALSLVTGASLAAFLPALTRGQTPMHATMAYGSTGYTWATAFVAEARVCHGTADEPDPIAS